MEKDFEYKYKDDIDAWTATQWDSKTLKTKENKMTQEIVTFENKKYQWKNLPEYGKSLVPYKDFLPELTKGSKYDDGTFICMVVQDTNEDKWGCVIVGPEKSHNCIGEIREGLNFEYPTLLDLKNNIQYYYPYAKIVS